MLVIGGSGLSALTSSRSSPRMAPRVGVLARGRPSAGAAHHIAGDRKRLGEHRAAIAAFAPEVVIDMIASSGAQAAAVRGVARRTSRSPAWTSITRAAC